MVVASVPTEVQCQEELSDPVPDPEYLTGRKLYFMVRSWGAERISSFNSACFLCTKTRQTERKWKTTKNEMLLCKNRRLYEKNLQIWSCCLKVGKMGITVKGKQLSFFVFSNTTKCNINIFIYTVCVYISVYISICTVYTYTHTVYTFLCVCVLFCRS